MNLLSCDNVHPSALTIAGCKNALLVNAQKTIPPIAPPFVVLATLIAIPVFLLTFFNCKVVASLQPFCLIVYITNIKIRGTRTMKITHHVYIVLAFT